MPKPSRLQDLTIPINTDENWDADDEDCGSDTTLDSFDSVPLSLPLRSKDDGKGPFDKSLFHFSVNREETNLLGAPGKSDGWISVSHFLWTMCATLADAGTDLEWTATFEQWRPQWNKIQVQAKRFGYTQFSSEIAPAPVDLALVRFVGFRHDQEHREFEIEQEGQDSIADCQDIWTLWRYIIETPANQIREFHVCLRDTARLVGLQ
ncbi:hypothetical protein N7497_005994 [Penicillium chrysogenum]|jgi:hypothetical protein|uniref:Uncharacterized protein n=1 Tax=Penicillium chrysogenum TaxID=5076 RepID=A0ABQ8WRK6_PENCH|nr:hypothetical protein N7505_003926 [Penicillium chrysogenum]KAJ6157109.1 hypothetical protein N7497_005994 [Penicillium chrysogenum]